MAPAIRELRLEVFVSLIRRVWNVSTHNCVHDEFAMACTLNASMKKPVFHELNVPESFVQLVRFKPSSITTLL